MVQKVKAGQAMKFKASEWNQIADATNHVNANRLRGGGPIACSRNYEVNGSDIILGMNSAGAQINQFDAVLVGTATPEPSHPDWTQKIGVNVDFSAGAECEHLAIAQENIAPGAFGRILVSGVSPARLTLTDSADDIAVGASGSGVLVSRGSTQSGKVGGQGLAILYSDGDAWGLVSVGVFSSCHATSYLGTLDGAIASDDDPRTATVDGLVALNGKATTASSLTAANHFEWDADDDAKCLITWDEAGERWVLIQVAC